MSTERDHLLERIYRRGDALRRGRARVAKALACVVVVGLISSFWLVAQRSDRRSSVLADGTTTTVASGIEAVVEDLEGHRFELVALTDASGAPIIPVASPPAYLEVMGSDLLLFEGCNGLTASYSLDVSGTLSVGESRSTLVGCTGHLQQQAAALRDLVRSGARLTIRGARLHVALGDSWADFQRTPE